MRINKRMAEYGATIVPDRANILHHCNTGALATVDIGTAIGVIYGECDSQSPLLLLTFHAHLLAVILLAFDVL